MTAELKDTETLRRWLERERDASPRIERFDGTTETAAAAADGLDCAVSDVATSIVMAVEEDGPLVDRLVVAVTRGDQRVSEAELASSVNADAAAIRLATPEEVESTLGWPVGGVPPVCHPASVTTVLDRPLLDRQRVWAGAGGPSAMFECTPEWIRDVTGATVAAISE